MITTAIIVFFVLDFVAFIVYALWYAFRPVMTDEQKQIHILQDRIATTESDIKKLHKYLDVVEVPERIVYVEASLEKRKK